MSQIRFFIPGKPKGKGRARFCRVANYMKSYTPEETASYENLVKVRFLQAKTDQAWTKKPADIPLCVQIACSFSIPKSWSKKKTAAAKWVTKKPDCDNIAKIILDSLNGLAYDDDASVVRLIVNKIYSTEDIVEVVISTNDPHTL